MRRDGERGIILIAVLLAVAIMSVMVVAASTLTRAGIGNERLEQRRLASHFALRSALEQAKLEILKATPDERLVFSGQERAVDLGKGITATVTLRDAAGYADLNRADPTLIEAVARYNGLGAVKSKNLADTVTTMRKAADPDYAAHAAMQKAQQAQNAQPAQPAGQKPAGPAQAQLQPIVFLALDQLPALLGLTEEEARQMADGFTVYNPTAAVNPLAAPDQVLAAVPGITQRDRADIAAARKSAAGSKDLRLKQVIDRANGLLAIASPSVFIIEVRIDGGDGVLQGSRARAVVRLEPNGALPFGTLALEED